MRNHGYRELRSSSVDPVQAEHVLVLHYLGKKIGMFLAKYLGNQQMKMQLKTPTVIRQLETLTVKNF